MDTSLLDKITVRRAKSESEMKDVIALRDRVYVTDQGRLSSVDDTKGTFDKYDAHGAYLVAYFDETPIGTVKVIQDSALGLPCEFTQSVDLSRYRPAARMVEFGHLISVPEARGKGVGLLMMKEGVAYSVSKLRATHILADLFTDENGGYQSFYTRLGFEPVCAPYRDTRFSGSPWSIVAMLELETGLKRGREAMGDDRALFEFFLRDWDRYAYSK